MALDLSKFKEKVSKEEIKRMEETYGSGNGGSVPAGTYPVRLSRMEVKANNFGGENLNISFKITDGDRKGQLIFYNGTFNKKPDSGYQATARLIAQIADDPELYDTVFKYVTSDDHDSLADYVDGLFEVLKGAYEYDLKYEVVEQTKINPNTGKPYGPNRFFSITDVYDI